MIPDRSVGGMSRAHIRRKKENAMSQTTLPHPGQPDASVLGEDIHTGEPVTIDQEQRLKGIYLIGKTGAGKTTLLVNMILQDIAQGMGVCFITPHGDAITDILKRLPCREEDVILLDLLDDEYAFGLNLFQCTNPQDKKEVSRTISHIMEIFAKLFTESGDLIKEAPNMARTLQYVIPVLLAHQSPHMTMAEIPLLIMDEIARPKLLAPITNPMVLSFWQSYHRWKADRQEELTASTMSRLGNFLLDPLIMQIVGQAETTLNFRQIMDNRKILLVKLSREYPLITSLIGSVIISQIANAAFSREDTPDDERIPFMLYADEYQRFATPTFAELLTEVRKYKVATCVAHQARGQLDHTNKVATLNAGTIIVYQVSGDDAKELAPNFQRTPPPPAVDWIAEDSGEKPVKAYKRDVIGHLLQQGHEDERVIAFRNDYLEKLRLASLKKVEHMGGEWIYPRNHLLIEYSPERIPEILDELNTWLFAGMRDKDALWQPLPVLGWLAHFFGFKLFSDAFYDNTQTSLPWQWYVGRYDAGWTTRNLFDDQAFVEAAFAAVENSLIDFVAEKLPEAGVRQAWQQVGVSLTESSVAAIQNRGLVALWQITGTIQAFAETHPELDAAMYVRRFLTELSEPVCALNVFLPVAVHAGNEVTPPDPKSYVVSRIAPIISGGWAEIGTTHPHDPERYKLALYQGIAEQLPSYLTLFPAFLRFFAELHCAQLALSQRPLETMDSGQFEPETRKHPLVTQRTYPEMESKIANELANPPVPYAARIKLGMQEYAIQALPYKEPDADAVWMARERRIIAQTHAGYCRERAEVDKEIKARQDELIRKPKRVPQATMDEDEE